MALSKHEQRTLDEIEQSLRAEDPQFLSTATLEHHRHHLLIVGGSSFVLGMVLLFVGEMAAQVQLGVGVVIGLAGFLVMLAAIGWMVLGSRPGLRRTTRG